LPVNCPVVLETIAGEEIRLFIREAQQRCKIAITSRVGLGELEFPRKLTGLTEQESTQLIREIAKVRNSEVLKKLSNKQLADISQQLHFNPLAMKWFVNSVDTGKAPKEVLNHKANLLNFCFSNVYEQLSDHAKLILMTILSARRPLNDAEVNFLTGLSPLYMRKALNSLFVTTLAKREVPARGDISECVYSISEFAKSFLLTEHPPNKELVQSVNKKMKQLTGSFEQATLRSDINEFNMKALEIRNQNEKVIARYLHEALRCSHPRHPRFDEALSLLAQAKDIVPNYFEIYRVSAFIKSFKGDLLGAEEDYKVALDIEPDNVRLLYFYSGFLMYQIDDVSAATPYAKRAYDLRPDSPETASMYARCIGYQGKYEQAILLLRKLMNQGAIASVKSRKILSSIIINFYRRWANIDIEINKDFKSAIEKLREAEKIFQEAEMASEIDHGMIKDFSEAVFYMLSYSLEYGDEDDKNKVAQVIERYQLYIEQSKDYSRIKELIPENFSTCFIAGEKKIYTGIVSNYQDDRTYAFIRSEAHGRLYFNKGEMISSKEWSKLNEGTMVQYSLGTNSQGECATRVKVFDQLR